MQPPHAHTMRCLFVVFLPTLQVWDVIAAAQLWDIFGVPFTPQPADNALGYALRSWWWQLVSAGELSGGWVPVDHAANFPSNYSSFRVASPGQRAVDLLKQRCDVLLQSGIGGPNYWWVN